MKGWIKCQSDKGCMRADFYQAPQSEQIELDWQACLCIFYCNPTSLSSLANRGDREAYTEYGGHARIHTCTLSQRSAPIWYACPESIHTKWMVLYMLFLQQPLQDLSFWLRRGTGIIDPSAVPWRAWLPEKMKSSVRGHIWSVSGMARPIGRPHINWRLFRGLLVW